MTDSAQSPSPPRDAPPPFAGAVPAGTTWSFHRLVDAAQAWLALVQATRWRQSVLVITEGPHALEQLQRDLDSLAATRLPGLASPTAPAPRLLCFPPQEGPADAPEPDTETAGLRIDTLLHLRAAVQADQVLILATCVQALLQGVPDPEGLEAATCLLKPGDPLDPDALALRLVSAGYLAVPEVQAKGEFARRGGLLDVWPVNAAWPARVECLGDQVESLRTFDPATQRGVERPAELRIAPVRTPQSLRDDGPQWLRGLPQQTLVVWGDVDAIEEHAALTASRGGASSSAIAPGSTLEQVRAVLSEATRFSHWCFQTIPPDNALPLDLTPPPPAFAPADTGQHPDARRDDRQRRWAAIQEDLDRGHQVHLFFDTAGALEHFRAEFPSPASTLTYHAGTLSDGFRSEALRLTVLAECNLFGQRKTRTRAAEPLAIGTKPTRDTGDRVADLSALRPGDLVVHLEHGLGRYLGVTEIEFDGQPQEVITLEYDEAAKLHVPVSHAHLLSRYVGVARARPTLHRLGGKRWSREKQDAQRAIEDLAAGLLETQARRNLLEGFACPPDTPWQREFEGSFPFEETQDQVRAIADTKQDMEARRPMDRLICGDAGYGKTEVAMRAAFKCVSSGRQVAVLVPTTVLAQQHYQTFSERMGPYPIRVEVLSRFTRARQSFILRGLAEGTVDVVIGTHALLQPSVHFKNLGLAVIDEEQRFGVAHKERLKHIRLLVDVLTLTATPIPRTLHLSLTGSRDMSLLQTPPRQRMAIETVLARNTDDVVRQAIRRELERDGQVYYLHNRIMTIERVRDRLARLVPEARIAVGHGRMAANELKRVMRGFMEGESDILLCTTIIESGLDIPRANTMLIDRADRFGIADLYQLRGRVGRSTHKAYAYFLIPAHGQVDPDARKRIAALQRHSALGAGFNLALRDLEIRGAGNILGAQQSGHIAAVGFGLYCQLLRRTVARLKGEVAPGIVETEVLLDFLVLSPAHTGDPNCACIPPTYVPAEPTRLDLYRRLAQTASLAELRALIEELRDRFGPHPSPLALLLSLHEVKLEGHGRGLRSVRVRDGKLILQRGGDVLMRERQFPRLRTTTAPDRLREILKLVRTCDRWAT